MRHFLSAYLYKVAVGAGMLVLAGLVSANIWLWQRDDASSQTARSGQGAPGRLEVPGLPAQNTTGGADIGDAGTASSGASVSDTVELEVHRGGPVPGQAEAVRSEDAGGTGPVLTAASVQDTASLSESTLLEPSGTGRGITAGDAAAVSDSAELEVQQAQPPPPSGGPGGDAVSDTAELDVQQAQPPPPRGVPRDDASFGDSAELVVRDASGNIKQQETVN